MRPSAWTSERLTAKSVTIKRRDGRSGGCVGKAVKLTSGDLHCCPEVGTEEAARHPERGAEVSRGRSREEAGSAIEALRKPKGGETASVVSLKSLYRLSGGCYCLAHAEHKRGDQVATG